MSSVRKRSVTIRGHRTSFSVEDAFMEELVRIAGRADKSLSVLVAEIDEGRPRGTNLSSAIRLHVLQALRCREHEG